MSKKTKEIILIAIICIIKLSLNALPIILIVKEWDSFVGLALGFFVFFAFLLYYFTSMDSLPEREITYGEFPFEIVYTIDEEEFEKQGIAICKCKKTFDLVYGAYWDFEMYFDDSYDDDILCTELYEIKIDCGNASYYLDGEKPYEKYVPGEYIWYFSEGKYYELTLEEAKEEFGIEIISTKFSEPLVNTEDEKDN